MTIHTMAQRSPEWYQIRLGKMTGSAAKDMLATIKSGEAAARRDLRMRLVCEELTGQPQGDGFMNAAMERGVDKEPNARNDYGFYAGVEVQEVGFIEHDELKAGCSPDGLVGDDGMVEIKCPKSATHLRYLRFGGLESDYNAQVRHNLYISGRAWCDLVSWDDRFPTRMQLVVVRMHARLLNLAEYDLALRTFLAEVQTEVAALKGWEMAS